jgi:cystathionine gamma-lyase
MKFGTITIHGGQKPNPIHGAVCPGIELSTTYAQKSPGIHSGFEYSRTGNPTRKILENLIAKVEYGKYGICFASGSATTSAVLNILKSGDHIISIDDVYGGTNRYFQQIAEKLNNMKVTFLDLTSNLDNLRNNLKNDPKVTCIWLETPTNPTLKVCDIEKICLIAHEFNVMVCVDNTFATPYNVNPLNLGADIVVHSITKYLNGHSDIVMGGAITNCKNIRDKLAFVQNSIGAVPSPFDCYMVIRGIKTLHLRMKKHAENALTVAKFLEKHPKIERVFYPGLKSHPNYEIASKQMKTGGGMVTFLLKGGLKESEQFLKNLKLFVIAESLGAVESLAEHPAIMTHASVPKEQRLKLGIFDNLCRLSIGIEDINDILNDLEQAL